MCGFIGVVGVPSAAREIFIALQTLQHRGQDSAGIATKDGDRFPVIKEMGTVPLALHDEDVAKLTGRIGIGHARYPTFGRPVKDDAQPFFYRQPGVLMAHNGNITNYDTLKRTLHDSSIHLLSMCDIEPVMCLFADSLMKLRPKDHTIDDALAALRHTYPQVAGAFSIVGAAELDGEDTLFVCRDTAGIRPAVWGRRGGSFMVASESVALDALGYTRMAEVDPGQVIFFREDREPIQGTVMESTRRAPCVFEHIYFARPDSVLDGRTVYEVRLELGRRLAQEWSARGMEIDTVIPVPDTSRPAATAFAEAIGKPHREGFIKNRYFGRTFIMPDQPARSLALRLKLNPIRCEIEGKRVLVIDDSIVRGNTVRSIIALVRAQNPKEIHLAIYSPPVISPCYYGIDMSIPEELLARRHLGLDFSGSLTLERQRAYENEVAQELGLDSLTYLSQEGLEAVASWPKCAACFTGRYPQPLSDEQRFAIELNRGEVERV